MQKSFAWPHWLTGLLFMSITCGASAAGVSPALQKLAQDFIARHPAAQAARADLELAEARARAGGQPLYNPEIEVDYEDAVDVTKTVGLAQTFDWTGKRRARNTAGQNSVRAARAALQATRQQMLGELLNEFGNTIANNQAAHLAQQRVKLLNDFLYLAERRYAAGDVGQTDVDLARLAVSEARMQLASTSAEATAAEARLAALVQTPAGGWPALPALPQDLPAFNVDELLRRHPTLQQSEAEAAAARSAIDIARLDRRPDPTVGIRGGQEDDETLVGVTVSIPLFVRNTFRAELDAANADAVRAEQSYYNQQRRTRGSMQAAAQRYRVTRAALDYWDQSGQPSLKDRVELLKRLWETGEISATDYLVQLQQTLDTQASAVELKGNAWRAWVAWLTASGTTEDWLGL